MLGIKNVKIETISNGTIENGSIVLDDGKIAALGKELDLSNCRRIIDGDGRVITPGIIDPHTHLGLSESGVGREGADTNEGTSPLTPLCSVIDGINMRDQAFESFSKSGITSVGILPGSGNIIGGTGLALKCKGHIVDESVIKNPIGLKVALGENPKTNYGDKKKSPATRMGNTAILRGALLKAKEYLDNSSKNNSEFKKDMEAEALLPVIKGEIPLIIHCHRHDDIVTAIRVCKEFNVKFTLEHVTDGHLVKDIIKEEKVHCGVGPTLQYASKVENKDRDFRTPIAFDREGIPFCFITDHPVLDGRNLMLTASIATQWGMSDENALRAVTLSSAEHIGIDNRVGSLEIGKDADIVIWSDNPLEFTTFVDMTIIDGEIVYERKVK
ncbi:MAG TPA: amidohydrolase [Clostridia bacterium]|nr:amidohydrolase [Clostridia bacterium]